MIGKGIIILQNCTHPLKVEPDSYIEPNTYSNDGTDIIDIKVELSDIKKDEYTVPVRSAGINAEQEVSYMSVCLYTLCISRLCVVCSICVG
jgi:hypothetical protein